MSYFLLYIVMTEICHLLVLFTSRDLLQYQYLVMAGSILFALVVAVLELRKKRKPWEMGNRNSAILLGISCLPMIWHLIQGYVIDLSDAVYEIAISAADTGRIYENHIFMGGEALGLVPLRVEILGLSSLYASLISLFGGNSFLVLGRMIPLLVWGLSLYVVLLFARKFFPDQREKQSLMLVFYNVVLWVSSGIEDLIGYRMYYEGFSGETIRAGILIPYAIYAVWNKKWWQAALVCVVEACLVWTSYGVGYCILACVVTVLCTRPWGSKSSKRKALTSEKI